VIGLLFLFFDVSQLSSIQQINDGDLLVFIGAIFCSLQMVLTGKLVKNLDVVLFSMIQLAFIASLSFISALIFQEDLVQLLQAPTNLWLVWIYLGIIATTLSLFFQNYSQRVVKPETTALIFMLVPVFSAIFGVFLGQEAITLQVLIGGGFVIIGILISSINKMKIKNSQKKNSE
jgi:drug/metabolite transporter (DMT)-like permease